MVAEKKNKIMEVCPHCVVPGSDGVMPIKAFNSPIRSYHSSERGYDVEFTSNNFLQERYFKLIADCGINLIDHFEEDYSKYPEDTIQALKWCEKYGFKMWVSDKGLRGDMTEEELTARISEYGGYKSFAGVLVRDEPCNDTFPVSFEGAQKLSFCPMNTVAELARKLNNYDNMVGHIGLLPHYYWMQCYPEDYENYIEELFQTCDPKILNYDNYLFDDPDRARGTKWWFYNLTVMRKFADKYDVPLWPDIQCGSQWNFTGGPIDMPEYRPTKYEFFWNVNVVLAFGCKAVAFYPLVQPYTDALAKDGGLDCDRGGILGADGEPTMWYGFVRQITKQVRAVESVLMQCKYQGVLALGNAQTYTKGLYSIMDAEGYKELKSVKCRKAGAFVGCLDYEGKTAFYIANNDTKRSQDITLCFDDVYSLNYVSYVKNETKETDKLKFTLGPGGGMLVVVNKK